MLIIWGKINPTKGQIFFFNNEMFSHGLKVELLHNYYPNNGSLLYLEYTRIEIR